MVSSVPIALLAAIVFGGAATAYIRWIHRPRLETSAGLKIVAGMRWREFSQLVVEALRERGFEAESQDHRPHRGHQADLVLRRDGRTWLLACKQGAEYRITPAVLAEFSKSMRLNAASNGVMATPGRVDADARKQAGEIELIDGFALWPLLKPRLPASVRDSVAGAAQGRSLRYVMFAWFIAIVLGAGVAWMMPAPINPTGPSTGAGRVAQRPPPIKTVADTPVVLAPAPLSDKEQREKVRQEVSNLPGIDRAMWSTPSTLLIYLGDDTGADRLASICAVMERHDALRASRLQLQPVPGSMRAVRFLQCKAF